MRLFLQTINFTWVSNRRLYNHFISTEFELNGIYYHGIDLSTFFPLYSTLNITGVEKNIVSNTATPAYRSLFDRMSYVLSLFSMTKALLVYKGPHTLGALLRLQLKKGFSVFLKRLSLVSAPLMYQFSRGTWAIPKVSVLSMVDYGTGST